MTSIPLLLGPSRTHYKLSNVWNESTSTDKIVKKMQTNKMVAIPRRHCRLCKLQVMCKCWKVSSLDLRCGDQLKRCMQTETKPIFLTTKISLETKVHGIKKVIAVKTETIILNLFTHAKWLKNPENVVNGEMFADNKKHCVRLPKNQTCTFHFTAAVAHP